MIVLEIEGWEQSYGVRAEIELGHELGLPIFYLSPEDLFQGQVQGECLRSHPRIEPRVT